MRRFAFLLCLGALAVGPAGTAFAAGSNTVTVDPDSPSGTQYEIPIDKARGTGQAATGDGDDDPLFGEGVTSDGANALPAADADGSDSDDSGTLFAVIAGALVLVALAAVSGWAIRRRTAG